MKESKFVIDFIWNHLLKVPLTVWKSFWATICKMGMSNFHKYLPDYRASPVFQWQKRMVYNNFFVKKRNLVLLHTATDVATKEIMMTQSKWFTNSKHIRFKEATKQICAGVIITALSSEILAFSSESLALSSEILAASYEMTYIACFCWY